MAISNIAQPLHKYVTGYNPIVFVNDSDNKTENGFRYLYDIYSAGTNNLLASYQIAPRIGDGYGVLSAEKVLQNYLTYNFSASTLPFSIRDSWVAFDVKVGETFEADPWTYIDYQFFIATGTTNHGYTELYNTATTHNYSVGDQINIVQSDEPNPAFPQLSGLHTVRFVPSPNSIVIDLVFVYANPGVLISGTTTFADNQKQFDRDLFTYSAYTAFNGAVPTRQGQFNANEYVLTALTGSVTNKFLTTAPDELRKTRNEEMFWNIMNARSTRAFYVRYQNDTNDTFQTLIVNNTQPLLQVPIGPAAQTPSGQLTATTVSGTQPLIKPNTKYYDVWITDSIGIQQTRKKRIVLDDRCAINDIHISFLDRLGSFGSFAFQLKYNDTTAVDRQIYNRQDGEIQNGTWVTNNFIAGNNVNSVSLARKLQLNTNWMTEDEARYFDELVSSPVTFLFIDGQYQLCTIDDSSYETSQQRNKKLIRKTITVSISANDYINY